QRRQGDRRVGGRAASGGPRMNALDPLSAAEIEAASALVRADGRFGEGSPFAAISTAEPPRAEAPNARRRRAEVLLHQRDERAVIRFVVDLEAGAIESAELHAGAEPAIGLDELERFEAGMGAEPRFVVALKRRGIDDPATVDID